MLYCRNSLTHCWSSNRNVSQLLPQKLAETYVRDEEMVCLDIERRDMSLLYCSSVSFQNIAGKLAQVFQTCVSRKGVVNAKRTSRR